MTELREHLADAIDKAMGDNVLFSPIQIANVVLSLPRIAIVQLPEPDSTRYDGDEHEPMDRLCWMPGDDFEVSVWDCGEIQRCGYGWTDCEPISVAEGRTIAAVLLAAADAAEAERDSK